MNKIKDKIKKLFSTEILGFLILINSVLLLVFTIFTAYSIFKDESFKKHQKIIKNCYSVKPTPPPVVKKKRYICNDNKYLFNKIHWNFYLTNECGKGDYLTNHCCANNIKDPGGYTCYGVSLNRNREPYRVLLNTHKLYLHQLKNKEIFSKSYQTIQNSYNVFSQIYNNDNIVNIRDINSEIFEPYAKDFIYKNFYLKTNIYKLCAYWRQPVFDFAVNSGVKTAVKFLQNVLKVSSDGIIGSQTIKASCKNKKDIDNYNKLREKYIKSLRVFNNLRSGFLHRFKENRLQTWDSIRFYYGNECYE